jgi:mono/diheme cytochrome c family protein
MKSWKILILALCGIAIVATLYALALIRRGFSATDEPSSLERVVARTARNLAIPSLAKNEPNPWKATPDTLKEAREIFIDRCAVCHGNDGAGQTTVGRNLYPKPPDLRLPRTQALTDGQFTTSSKMESD